MAMKEKMLLKLEKDRLNTKSDALQKSIKEVKNIKRLKKRFKKIILILTMYKKMKHLKMKTTLKKLQKKI